MDSRLVAAVITTLLLPRAALPDAIDRTFGADGIVVTDVGRRAAAAHAVLVQQDGRIIVAGDADLGHAFALARYRTDGSLDPDFGNDGQVVTPIASRDGGGVRALAADAQGRIVAAGEAGGRLAVLRYLDGGRLDRAFGMRGSVTPDVDGPAVVHAVAIQTDGRILVGGRSSSASGREHHAIVHRYAPDGAPDRTFGDDGTAKIALGGYCDGITSLALQGDGRIVVAGEFDRASVLLARLLADGTPDPSFASAGIRIEPGPGFQHVSLAVQGDGHVLVAWAAQRRFVARRYTADGRPDAAFGNGGATESAALGGTPSVRSLIVHGDGRVTIAGLVTRGFRSRLAVARFLRGGEVDEAFAAGGARTARIPFGEDVAIGPGGELVVAGSAPSESDGTNQDFAVARFLADGSADPGFGRGGQVRTELTGGDDQLAAIALERDGRTLVAGWTSGGLTATDFALARYEPDGSLDRSFGDGGRARVDTLPEDARGGDPSEDRADAMALQRDGRIVLAGSTHGSQLDALLARLTPDGALDPSFGRAGRVTYGTSDDDLLTAIAVQRDERIVAAGQTFTGGLYGDLMLLRVLPDGQLDTSFGVGGRVRDEFGSGDSDARSLAIDRNGAILVAGSLRRDDEFVRRPALARYRPDGAPDPGFGTLGKVVTDLGAHPASLSAIALQKGGGIVAVGWSEARDDFLVLRFRPNGKLDTTFGESGVASAGLPGGRATAVAIDSRGRIVVGGSSTRGRVTSFAVARFRKDGSRDDEFGNGGTMTTTIRKGAAGRALALAPNGDILLAGIADGRHGSDFAVARYLGGAEW